MAKRNPTRIEIYPSAAVYSAIQERAAASGASLSKVAVDLVETALFGGSTTDIRRDLAAVVGEIRASVNAEAAAGAEKIDQLQALIDRVLVMTAGAVVVSRAALRSQLGKEKFDDISPALTDAQEKLAASQRQHAARGGGS